MSEPRIQPDFSDSSDFVNAKRLLNRAAFFICKHDGYAKNSRLQNPANPKNPAESVVQT
jgi:hypothetical protein